MINTGKIPAGLRRDALFCCWQYEERDGRQTKVPYNPATGKRAESNNSNTFTDFDTAVTASGKYSGLGVGIFRGVCGIDIDHCVDKEGTISASAADIIKKMNSYTELSPSGSGIHILFKAEGFAYDKSAYYINNSKAGIEVYVFGATNKYLTCTGNALYENRDIEERSEALSTVLDRYMRRGSPAVYACKPVTVYDEILQKAAKAKNGDKFNRLWNGDISGYKSQSEADQALCNILSFYAKGDAAVVDRLFRQSGLMRPKWDEKRGASAYGADTINKACEAKIIPVLKMQDDLNSRPYIGHKEKIDKNGHTTITDYIIEQELYRYIRQNTKYIFASSGAKSGIQRYIYRNGVYCLISDELFKGFIRDNIPPHLHRTGPINEVFKLLVMDYDRFTRLDALDSDEDIVNFNNGLLNLKTMELLPHSSDVLSAIRIPCDYLPSTQIPQDSVFEKFMNHLTYGDPERRELILQFMGVALSNVCGFRMKKALFMVGDGNTGKSQCKELLIRLLGDDKFSGIGLDELEGNEFSVSELFGKRLAGSSDMGYVRIKELLKFKQLVAGDTVTSRYLFENAFRFKFKGVFWFCGNRLPKFSGDLGDWVYDRITIIECSNPVLHKDPLLIEKMYAEKEYIVKCCIDALQRLIKNNYEYIMPESSMEMMRQYKVNNNSVLSFLDECTVPRPSSKLTDKCTVPVVYKVYCAWCKNNNNGYTDSKADFKKIIENAGKGEVKKTYPGIWYYTAFTLSIEAKMEYSYIYGFDTVVPSGEKSYG